MKVVLEVTVEIEPKPYQIEYAKAAYEPTPESPEPDDEWIAEEIALTLLAKSVPAIESITVIG